MDGRGQAGDIRADSLPPTPPPALAVPEGKAPACIPVPRHVTTRVAAPSVSFPLPFNPAPPLSSLPLLTPHLTPSRSPPPSSYSLYTPPSRTSPLPLPTPILPTPALPPSTPSASNSYPPPSLPSLHTPSPL